MNIYVFALVIVGCVYQTVGETTIPVTFVTEKNINSDLDHINYFHARLCGGNLYDQHWAIVHINLPNRPWNELQGDFVKCDVLDSANSQIISQNYGINGHTPTFTFKYRKEYGNVWFKCTTPNTPGQITYTLAMRWLDWRKPMTKEAPRFVSTKAEMTARNDLEQELRSQGKSGVTVFVQDLVSVYLTDDVRKVNTQDNEQLVLNYCFKHDEPGYINVAVTAVDQKSGFATYVCPGVDGPCGATLTPFADSSGASVNFVKALINGDNNIGPVKVMVRGDGRFGTTNNYLLTASKFNPITATDSCKA